MSEKKDAPPKHQEQGSYGGSPTTEQMRSVGQRRRDAEEKLEHHLEEVRHKEDSRTADAAEDDAPEGPAKEAVDSADVAAIQNDDRLTAADRVDLIANQVVAGDEDSGPGA
ncbi:hypothetical protein QFZ65_002125 [Arthrobacter sp. B3I9]|uniref:hypothetical protein n=1 Tax=Arthrobacter sp. B3I9 TaxID=3042270 RepID=UPI00278F8D1A|nr:hypothetical protein [Arthrobacter sp. B3I9]MDQ0850187.1 hypothetical protein [Arthrobacter sp. B3I9]